MQTFLVLKQVVYIQYSLKGHTFLKNVNVKQRNLEINSAEQEFESEFIYILWIQNMLICWI
jgi:hypothetical protein